jgi:hypothetical protein
LVWSICIFCINSQGDNIDCSGSTIKIVEDEWLIIRHSGEHKTVGEQSTPWTYITHGFLLKHPVQHVYSQVERVFIKLMTTVSSFSMDATRL